MKRSLFVLSLLIILVFHSSCSPRTIKRKDKIIFNENNYTACFAIDLDLEKEIDDLLMPIGSFDVLTVNEIRELPVSEWIYLTGETNGCSYYLGLYVSDSKAINSLSDFNADSVCIFDASSLEGVYKTEDISEITYMTNCIIKGNKVDNKNQASVELQNQYRIAFRSSDFPNLVYPYNLDISIKDNYYIWSNDEVYQIDDSLKKYIKR